MHSWNQGGSRTLERRFDKPENGFVLGESHLLVQLDYLRKQLLLRRLYCEQVSEVLGERVWLVQARPQVVCQNIRVWNEILLVQNLCVLHLLRERRCVLESGEIAEENLS